VKRPFVRGIKCQNFSTKVNGVHKPIKCGQTFSALSWLSDLNLRFSEMPFEIAVVSPVVGCNSSLSCPVRDADWKTVERGVSGGTCDPELGLPAFQNECHCVIRDSLRSQLLLHRFLGFNRTHTVRAEAIIQSRHAIQLLRYS
jgi:hypothetical protein